MQTILLALIAGLLAIKILAEQFKDEDPFAILVIGIPVIIIAALIGGAIFWGIALGLNTLLGNLGIAL